MQLHACVYSKPHAACLTSPEQHKTLKMLKSYTPPSYKHVGGKLIDDQPISVATYYLLNGITSTCMLHFIIMLKGNKSPSSIVFVFLIQYQEYYCPCITSDSGV